ncbi:hypothetical protein RRG08_006249 [Elysia crispata]|uniref:Uncharacterized protein n=1 Tax=Elysia crispata TaxID=231223 RepID=A0AAE0YPP8_9GAST|nr:hypothetical protein RRG08_006249 [Elysia crispata]
MLPLSDDDLRVRTASHRARSDVSSAGRQWRLIVIDQSVERWAGNRGALWCRHSHSGDGVRSKITLRVVQPQSLQ